MPTRASSSVRSRPRADKVKTKAAVSGGGLKAPKDEDEVFSTPERVTARDELSSPAVSVVSTEDESEEEEEEGLASKLRERAGTAKSKLKALPKKVAAFPEKVGKAFFPELPSAARAQSQGHGNGRPSTPASMPGTPRMMTRRASFAMQSSGQKPEPLVSLLDRVKGKPSVLAQYMPPPIVSIPLFILAASVMLALADAFTLASFPGLLAYKHPDRTYFSFLPGLQPTSEAIGSFARYMALITLLAHFVFFPDRQHWGAVSTHHTEALMLAAVNTGLFLVSFVATGVFRHWHGALFSFHMVVWAAQLYLVNSIAYFRHSRSDVLVRMLMFSVVGCLAGQALEDYSIHSGFYQFAKEQRHAGHGYPMWLPSLCLVQSMTVAAWLPVLKLRNSTHKHH